jgi:two-component system sensor histidine kinase/response regulator
MSNSLHSNLPFKGWMVALLSPLWRLRSPLAATSRTASSATGANVVRVPDPPRILIVDDCPINQLWVASLLSGWGITPQAAADGAEAIAHARGQEFDLILMDLQMPVLDGVSATKLIRRLELEQGRRRVPVVAHTASQFGREEPMLRACGIDDSLEKPCSARSLEDCLQRWDVPVTTTGKRAAAS